MGKPKVYNPLSLDVGKDEPTFVNELGVKWWLIGIGSSLADEPSVKDGVIYLTLMPDGKKSYIVVLDDQIVKETGNLEYAAGKTDQIYLVRTK